MTLNPGEPLKPGALREVVKQADYRIRAIRVRATGEVSVQESGLAFKIPGQTFRLLPPQKNRKQKSPPDRLPELKQAVREGAKRFTLTGNVHEAETPVLGLSVEIIHPPEKDNIKIKP